MNNNPIILTQNIRDGLVEEVHRGFLIYADSKKIINKWGDDDNYPYYLRSCAKPLQASLIIDFESDKAFSMTEEEIAICMGSHTGEKIHENIIKGLLDKIGLTENNLKCGIHPPLSKTRQNEMLLNNITPTQIHNNCSGKHTMMLALCVKNGWDIRNYDDINHPLQKKIKKKIYELCEIKNEFPITKDGCGGPIFSMPLENMLKGYFNLFLNPKYNILTQAMLNNPYIIGGEDRTDTKVIQHSKNIVCKTGAGGLFIVVDILNRDGFIVKISDCDMKAREAVVISFLKQLNRADVPFDNNIKTIHGDIIGKINTLFDK